MLSLRGAVSVLATITLVVAAATPVFPPWHPPGPGDGNRLEFVYYGYGTNDLVRLQSGPHVQV